jgi:flagellar hook-length control protein FliK
MTTLLTPVHEPFIPSTRNDRAQNLSANSAFRADLAQAKEIAEPLHRSELTNSAEQAARDEDDAERLTERGEQARTERPSAGVEHAADKANGAADPKGDGTRSDEAAKSTDDEEAEETSGQSRRGDGASTDRGAGGVEHGEARDAAVKTGDRAASADGRFVGAAGRDAAGAASDRQGATANAAAAGRMMASASGEAARAAVASTQTADGPGADARAQAGEAQADRQSQAQRAAERGAVRAVGDRAQDLQQRHEAIVEQRQAEAQRAQAAAQNVQKSAETAGRPASAFQSTAGAEASPTRRSGEASEAGRQFLNLVAQAEGRGNAVIMPAMARVQTIESGLRLEQAGTGSTRIAEQLNAVSGPALSAGGEGGGSTSLSSGLLSDGDAAESLNRSTAGKETSFAQRVMRGLHAMVNQKGGVMTMRLDPPELGSMRIQMVLQQGTVSAQFNVNTDQAQQLLNRNMQALKSALEARGLTVERLTVTNAGANDGSSAARNDNGAGNHAQHQQGGSQHDAGQGMSRGRSDGGHDGGAARHGGRSAQSFEEAFEPMRGSAEAVTE